MTTKLSKYEENRQAAEKNINQQLIAQTELKTKERALVMLGAVGAVNHIASTLQAQTMRGLQAIRDEKVFESFGFTRFDDFLNESEYSPMSYRQFIDREKMLETEGDQLFDILNSSKMSHRQRRLLGAGHVQVDEAKGTVIIVTGEDLEETTEEIALDDRSRLLQTLSALADQAALLNQKNTKQKKQIERGEAQVEDLKKKIDDLKNRPGELTSYQLMMSVTNSLDAFADFLKQIPEIKKIQERDLYLNTIRAAFARLEQAYGRKNYGDMSDDEIKETVAKKVKKLSAVEPDDELPDLTSSMDEEELAAMME